MRTEGTGMVRQDHQETLTTASGKWLWELMRAHWSGNNWPEVEGLVAKVEAEAAARQVTELRAALTVLISFALAGPSNEAATAARDLWIDKARALLSAGDKAEAPRPCCEDKGGAFCRDTTGLATCFDGTESREAGDKAEAPR